jgi:Arc/MetJ-type ribon-helix-helix transcriptional regulator
MNEEKKKRGRPPKIFTAETTGMTYEGAINYALDRQIKSELDKTLADKSDSELTDEERKYLDGQRSNRTRTLNIRFTEHEYRDIEDKCQQYGYKKKSEYVRDCVRARVPTAVQQVDLSEINRELKAIGNNINQIAVRLHSTGNIYAEDMQEIRQEVKQIWQLLLSIPSRPISVEQSLTSSTEIRPSTEYMSHLICVGTTAEGQPRTLPKSDSEEQDELPF